MKPKLLVTGGSGYLGDWVVRLAHSAWDVAATYFSIHQAINVVTQAFRDQEEQARRAHEASKELIDPAAAFQATTAKMSDEQFMRLQTQGFDVLGQV